MNDSEKLIKWVVQRPINWTRTIPRWNAVADIFDLETEEAIELCRKYGCDPHETKPTQKQLRVILQ